MYPLWNTSIMARCKEYIVSRVSPYYHRAFLVEQITRNQVECFIVSLKDYVEL